MPEETQNPEQQTVEPAATSGPEQPLEGGKTDPWADPDAARKEIEKLRKEAAKYRTAARDLEPLAKKARDAEEAQKSETERLTGQLAEAEKRVQAIRQRAVRSEVKALAAAQFADPEDAHAFLDLDAYVDDGGDIDTARIQTDLAELLKRKPHLGKPQEGPRAPRPDRTQGSSGNGNRTPNDPGTEFAGFMNRALQRGR